MILFSLLVSILGSIGSVAWGYWQAGFEQPARWVIFFGIFWLVAVWQRWRWVPAVWVVCAVLFAILGLWLDVNFGWMFSGALFAVFAWDLTEFRHRMRMVARNDEVRGMEIRRLLRLGLLAILGGGVLILIYWILL